MKHRPIVHVKLRRGILTQPALWQKLRGTVKILRRPVGGQQVHCETRVRWDKATGDHGGFCCRCAEQHIGSRGVEA